MYAYFRFLVFIYMFGCRNYRVSNLGEQKSKLNAFLLKLFYLGNDTRMCSKNRKYSSSYYTYVKLADEGQFD